MSAEVASKPSPGAGGFQDKDKPTEVRLSNITAAKGTSRRAQSIPSLRLTSDPDNNLTSVIFLLAVGDAIRTSLGPRGMDKMVRQ